jgi:hypothetical protein
MATTPAAGPVSTPASLLSSSVEPVSGNPSAGTATTLTVGSGSGWYIIEYPVAGRQQVDYTDAPNEQTAAEFTAGTTVLGGPYATQAAAEAAFNSSAQGIAYNASPQSPAGSGASGSSSTPSTTNQQPSNPLSWLEEIGHWMGVFVAALTDKYMWISLGWLALGLILVVVAILTLVKKTDLLPSVVPVPV